jgi:hypothetical protein
MILAELFKQLSYGQLSNLSLSGNGSGVIVGEQKPKIISMANEALLKLYSRFILNEKTMVLALTSATSRYSLTRANSIYGADPNNLTGYIIDTEDNPFLGDVVRVLAAHDSFGVDVALNDDQANISVFTPAPEAVQIRQSANNIRSISGLMLTYQAKHPELDVDGDDEQLIELPDVLEPALRAYVSYMVFSGMNGPENSAKAAEHMSQYEATCLEIIDKDLVSSSYSRTNTRFSRNGWA